MKARGTFGGDTVLLLIFVVSHCLLFILSSLMNALVDVHYACASKLEWEPSSLHVQFYIVYHTIKLNFLICIILRHQVFNWSQVSCIKPLIIYVVSSL